MRNTFTDNIMVNHFKNVDYRKKLYRNRRDAKIWGVCAGIADYLEVNVFAVRLVFLAMLFMTVFFPVVLLYIGATLVLDPKPLSQYDDEPVDFAPGSQQGAGASRMTQDGAQGTAPRNGPQRARMEEKVHRSHFSKRREFQFCAHKFAALHGRLARMEAYVTSNRFKLHREFKNIS
jgi:phage shock protein C